VAMSKQVKALQPFNLRVIALRMSFN
jgi:hypothetical protein